MGAGGYELTFPSGNLSGLLTPYSLPLSYMKEVSSLAAELKAHLPWHQARIIFLAQFMLSLLRARSTNLYRVAENFQSTALTESSYRRIKRFFWGYEVCLKQIGKLILHWLGLERYTLCMDRTNWKYGGKDINYLVVSVAWQGVSIPIAWVCLTKGGGNSSTQERIDLMKKVIALIPAEKIDNLLADREFIGREWFEWLEQNHLLFRLRIREDFSIDGRNGKKLRAGQLFRHLKYGQSEVWMTKRRVSDVLLYIAARRSPKGLLIVVGTKNPETMIDDYSQRWSIETLFGCLKKRGFEIESTHMTEPEKMDKLMAILALTFLWCMVAGHWKYGEADQLPLNKHYRPQNSLFRLGLDLLRRVLVNSCRRSDETSFSDLLYVLSRT